ncbi:MAG: hypothetical protein FJX60_08900 [Alphaproteobacteria bacterium]|nr:hypothetical protein [Alphaproteobacteria bacterium]
MTQILKNLQLGIGFLIGLFAMLLLGIGLIAGIEAVIGKPLAFKIPILLVLAVMAGVLTARWVARFDLSRFVTAREKRPKPPPPPPKAGPAAQKRPWTFYLVGTLIAFWAISLAMIIVLFGPFGFADDPSLGIRLAKIAACTVAIAGLGGFLLRKEFAKLMSASQK